MNTTKPPFDNAKVRQAVAYVLPYDKIFDNALYGRGAKMYGGSGPVKSIAWPQPTAYSTDVAKAKALLAEAGYPNGFETTLSFDLGGATIGEPMAVLVQEALALDRHQGADQQDPRRDLARGAAEEGHADDDQPLRRLAGLSRSTSSSGATTARTRVFNTMSYQNPKLDKIITNARFAESKPIYDSSVKEMIQIAFDEVPRIPLFQPSQDVAMQKNVKGYMYWFHLQPDYRQLSARSEAAWTPREAYVDAAAAALGLHIAAEYRPGVLRLLPPRRRDGGAAAGGAAGAWPTNPAASSSRSRRCHPPTPGAAHDGHGPRRRRADGPADGGGGAQRRPVGARRGAGQPRPHRGHRRRRSTPSARCWPNGRSSAPTPSTPARAARA